MNLSLRAIKGKLKSIGMLTETGQPLSYSQFKNLTTIKEYGKKNRIVFSGNPKEALFGFYVDFGTYADMLREAYDWYKRIVFNDMGPINEGNVMIGNTGIPDEYLELEWEKHK